MVCGTMASPASPEPSPPSGGLKALWKQFGKTGSDVPSSELGSVTKSERVYLSSDVDRLDAKGKSRRGEIRAQRKTSDRPESHSVAEILRVLAAYCVNRKACSSIEGLKAWGAAQVMTI